MRTDRPIRVGIFRDAERARRVVQEARANGFKRVSVVTDDPNVQDTFRHLCDVREKCADPVHRTPGQVSLIAGVAGALIGVVCGFVAVVFLERSYGPPGAIMNIAIPAAGLIWGAFIGAMISRAWQGEAENFFDQDLHEGEILVAIEDQDPQRLLLAERLLRGEGVAPMSLAHG